MKSIPHIERLMVASVEQVLEHAMSSSSATAARSSPRWLDRRRSISSLIDFVRIRQIEEHHADYAGIRW